METQGTQALQEARTAPGEATEQRFPLSFAQEGLWFLDQMGGGGSAYNISGAYRLIGLLQQEALEASFQRVIDKHEILRTRFGQANGVPYQTICPRDSFALEVRDLRMTSRRQEQLTDELTAEALRPFDISQPRLLRVVLFRLAEEEYVLSLVLHHIVADGWSVGLLLSELSQFYAARLQDTARGEAKAGLAEPELQYVDYASWQREQPEDSQTHLKNLQYWEQKLQGAVPFRLAGGKGLPSSAGGAVRQRLDPTLVGQLGVLAETRGLTLFMIYLGAFCILLTRYGDQSEVTLGVPMANRLRPELETMIGHFVNTLVMRVAIDPAATVLDLLSEVKQVCLEAYEHQDISFDRVAKALRPERSAQANPFFDILFTMGDLPDMTQALIGLRAEPVYISAREVKADLTFSIDRGPASTEISAEYRSSLFEAEMMRELLFSYEQVLRQMAEDRPRALSAVGLLTGDRLTQWLQRNHNPRVARSEIDPSLSVVALFEEQARRRPTATALVIEGASLNYRELNWSANAVAHRLLSMRLGQEERVGVYLPRSFALVAALWGIWKAGAVYVPIDPDLPPERMRHIVEDANLRFVLTTDALAEAAGDVLKKRAAWLPVADPSAGGDESASSRNPAVDTHPKRLAYVIYTSGSTGLPKGAMNQHEGLSNRVAWMARYFSVTERDRILQKTPISFDVSVWELVLPLVTGAVMVLTPPGRHRDPAFLKKLVHGERISILHFVPSMLSAFLNTAGRDAMPSLRAVIASGEALAPELVERWYADRSATLYNLYGPTEAAVDVSCWECKGSEEGSVPIGFPISNLQMYALDRFGDPAPLGARAELFLGGIGVGRGYIGNPLATANVFMPDPFGEVPGRTLYRTGDWVRQLSQGAYDYLGRVDTQVKIRGNRVELGELEATLTRMPYVKEAAVVTRDNARGEKELFACLVLQAGDAHVTLRWIRQEIRRSLPSAIVPASWKHLSALPVTHNGKLDRAALADLTPDSLQEPGPATAHRTEAEQRMVALWQSLLGAGPFGLDDNFFDVGGHSLLLTQLQSRIADEWGVALELPELFQLATVRSLAARIVGTAKAAPTADFAAADSLVTAIEPPRVQDISQSLEEIAIVGMACRFPGAGDIASFWKNLLHGVESIHTLTPEELRRAGVEAGTADAMEYVPRAGVLGDTDLFDAPFFRISEREATLMDPQHRLLLECSWQALEAAGYGRRSHALDVGVFAGGALNTYLLDALRSGAVQPTETLNAMLANGSDFLSTRVSYKLNLTGPSMTVQSGCSTSLLAIHLACRALRNQECAMAVAGGVAVQTPESVGAMYVKGGIFSPDGHCRSFDKAAEGTVRSGGVGVVVLKPLSRAVRDRDHIHAVIRGSAVTNDGAAKAGYTAPSVQGQSRAVIGALRAAQVTADSISYVEAHGTATLAGDPIEVSALSAAYRQQTERRQFCALGSVKSNIGHTDTAAGVAGLIKVALSLEQEQIPRTLHIQQPNPHINFADSPFFLATETLAWPRAGSKRRAAVSSFGFGGTNVHMILEEAPVQSVHAATGRSVGQAGAQLLPFSANSPEALRQLLASHLAWRRQHPEAALEDIAFTRQNGREELPFRIALHLPAEEELANRLEQAAGSLPGQIRPAPTRDKVAFLFPGQGSTELGETRELFANEPVFRSVTRALCEYVRDSYQLPLLQHFSTQAAEQNPETATAAHRELWIQPILFILAYALAEQWMALGLEPDAMIGHSLGEYAAACVAGVLSAHEALDMVMERSRLAQSCAPGRMLAVACSEEDVRAQLGAFFDFAILDVAAVNGAASCVLSGEPEAVEQARAKLAAARVATAPLATTRAFHSRMLDGIVPAFTSFAATRHLNAPRTPYVSSVTGTWITREQATDPQYWGQQLRESVQFHACLQTLTRDTSGVLLEVAAGPRLGRLSRRVLRGKAWRVYDAGGEEYGSQFLLSRLGQMWEAGTPVQWHRHQPASGGSRIPLPTYPFERQRYWYAQKKTTPAVSGTSGALAIAKELRSVSRETAAKGLSAANDTETKLCKIWAEILGSPPLSPDENFFAAGGDSLLAIQLVLRIEKAGYPLSLSCLFANPTVRLLVLAVQETSEQRMPLMKTAREERGSVLSYEQERMWFLHQLTENGSAYNMPFSLRLRGPLDEEALRASIQEVVRRHEVMRSRFPEIDGRVFAYAVAAFTLPLPVTVLRGVDIEQQALAIAEKEGRLPFDLQRGPVVRARLLRLDTQDHMLLVSIHHIVSDGLSTDIMIREVSLLYQAFRAGEASPLPELPIQYADYAVSQHAWLQGAVLKEKLSYWQKQLDGAESRLLLPGMRPRPTVPSFKGAKRSFQIDQRRIEALRALGHEAGATLFMSALAVFLVLLEQYTGQQDLVVGSIFANRDRIELEPLIGFLANTIVLRNDLSGSPTFRELLLRVRVVCLDAYAHQIPPEKLIEQVASEGRASKKPLYDVWFQIDRPQQQLQLAGLEWESVSTQAASDTVDDLPFELSLVLSESQDGPTLAQIEYDTSLFPESLIQQIAVDYADLVGLLTRTPDEPVDQILCEKVETSSDTSAVAGAG